MSRPSEDELIERFFAPFAGEGGLGLKDDAALLRPRGDHDLVLTTDAIVSGVHFFPDDPPAAIGRKALGVNLSDLAAKGAVPKGFLLTLALPEDWSESWLKAFSDGLGEASRAFQCPLLGGDTVQAKGSLCLSVTAIGEIPEGAMVPRSGANVGDVICVTGTIGDAVLGLALRRGKAPWKTGLSLDRRVYLTDRYLHPRPRLALAETLRDHASAAMDISDGLAGDLAKMMRASGTTARIEIEAVPLSPAARNVLKHRPDLMDDLIMGGDDYEILCTVPEEKAESFIDAAAPLGIPVKAIGRVEAGTGLPVFHRKAVGKVYEKGSYAHF